MRSFIVLTFALTALLLVSCDENNLLPGGSGLIEATEVMVSSETAGQIMQLDFDNGDSINVGDQICIIDTSTIVLQLRQLEAGMKAAETKVELSKIAREQAASNYELARKEYNRVNSLVKTGSVNQQQYDQAENMYNQAELAIKQAEAALKAAEADVMQVTAQHNIAINQYDNCFPDAPMSGRVVDKYVEVGELVGPGSAIIKIAQLDTVEVKIYLPPADLTRIRLGGTAKIDPEDGSANPMTGKISWISSSAEFSPKNVQTKEARADLVYAVKINIPNHDERLKIGMPVMVTIEE